MTLNLKTIIEDINIRNGKQLFDPLTISGVVDCIKDFPKIVYCSHGVQSICLKSGVDYVIKCCIKRDQSILKSGHLFMSKVKELTDNQMPILPPNGILHEDDVWIVYTQPLCRVIEDVNTRFCYTIVKLVKLMVETDIRMSDIYYRNFGIYRNKIVMYDYHEVDDFQTSSNFLITNLYALFTMLGKHYGWSVFDTKISHWDIVINDNFGQKRFPEQLVDLLCALHGRDRETILKCSDQSLEYLKVLFTQQFHLYQNIMINDEMITITYPQKIYDYIFEFVHTNKLTNILDVHSCDRGLGLKLAQDFPNISITLGCSDQKEIIETREIINNYIIFNTEIVYLNSLDFNVLCNRQYDLVIYCSSFYDLLKQNKVDEISRLLKNQVSKYCLIEVPIVEHIDNEDLEKRKETKLQHVKSIHHFRSYMCRNQIKVNRCFLIDSCGSNISHYVFVCHVNTGSILTQNIIAQT
jgi:hypothetical protein